MRARLRRGFAAVAVMAMSIALLIVTLTGPVVSTTTDFSIFNSGWNGTSELAILTYQAGKFTPSFRVEATGTDISVVQLRLSEIELDPMTDALVIIGPTKSFSSTEGAIVGDFVRNGGTLLLADDFGTGNTLLTGMGASSRFAGNLVMDLAFEKQPEFSVCFDFSPDQMTHNVTTALLNYPSALTVNTSTTQTLARTSIASWMDTNGDRLQEPGEPRGPFPVLAKERLGLGNIVLLSDPSALINGMRGHLDNSLLSGNILNYISAERSSVYFDESHRDFFDPVAVTTQFTGDVPTNLKVALAILAFVLTMWIATDLVDQFIRWTVTRIRGIFNRVLDVFLPPAWRRRKPMKPEPLSPDEIERLSADTHPEWRIGLVRYLLRERERHITALGQRSLRDDKPDSP
jgi:hypothetical protein